MELSDEARAWIDKTKALHEFADKDGIVCLPSIRGEPAAHERLVHLAGGCLGRRLEHRHPLEASLGLRCQ